MDWSRFMVDLAQTIRSLSVAVWGEQGAVEMVGTSPSFIDVLIKVRKMARFDEPVLIVGETGSGKELVARALYLLSELRGRPFVSVNCPQYREGNLTVSELFGHKKGSFTGAVADRKGAFEEASGGVIFLDEISDLHPSAQAMLLRALASGEYKPVGSDRCRRVNVRVLAATNRAARDLMVGAEFRRDLYFRLRYFVLPVPRLRDRGDDWRLILDYVLVRLGERYGVAKRFSEASLELLQEYHWPGNVRELISMVTAGYAMADGDVIEPKDFAGQAEAPWASDAGSESLYRRVVVDEEDFWSAVYRPFLRRDLNRAQVKAFVRQGLITTHGSYRELVRLLHLPDSQYQKFMDFLRHHELKP